MQAEATRKDICIEIIWQGEILRKLLVYLQGLLRGHGWQLGSEQACLTTILME